MFGTQFFRGLCSLLQEVQAQERPIPLRVPDVLCSAAEAALFCRLNRNLGFRVGKVRLRLRARLREGLRPPLEAPLGAYSASSTGLLSVRNSAASACSSAGTCTRIPPAA